MQYISIFSTIVALAFAVAVFNRFRQRGGLHLLFWTIGLVFYGLGTLTEVSMLFTFSPLALKVWYISGAMMTAAWLGQGTVWLLFRKPGFARVSTYILAALSLLAVFLVACGADHDEIPEHILASGGCLVIVGAARVAAIVAHRGTPGNSGCLFTDGGLKFYV